MSIVELRNEVFKQRKLAQKGAEICDDFLRVEDIYLEENGKDLDYDFVYNMNLIDFASFTGFLTDVTVGEVMDLISGFVMATDPEEEVIKV